MSKRIPVTIVCVVVAATIALIATRWLVPSSAVRAGDELGEGDIIVLPVNPSNAVQGDKFRPQWGPDLEPECSKFGDYIVFELNDTTYEAHHLYLYQFRAGGDVGPYPLIDIDNANDPDVDRLNPQWSPDGNWIIFSKVVNGYSQIFRAALRESDQDDYSTEIQITSGSTNHRNARWSPSTSVNLIVFERDVSGVSKIFKQCPTSLGSNPVQLTTGTKDDHRPVWNRTATRVVFERELNDSDFVSALYTTPITNPNAVLLATDGGATEAVEDRVPRWFDDFPTEAELNSVIVFERTIGTGRTQIYEVSWNPYVTSPTNLTASPLTSETSYDHFAPRIDGVFSSRVVYIRSDGAMHKIARLETGPPDAEIAGADCGAPEISVYANNVVFEYESESAYREIAIFDTSE